MPTDTNPDIDWGKSNPPINFQKQTLVPVKNKPTYYDKH